MTSGTKVLLALIGLFVGILVLYYGFLMPSSPPGSGGLVRDPALETTSVAAEPESPKITARQVMPMAAAEPGSIDRNPAVSTPDAARSASRAASTAGSLGGATQRPAGVVSNRLPLPVPARTTDSAPPATSIQSPTAATAPPPATTVRPAVTTTPPAPASRGPEYTRYVVKDGDTMTSIADEWFGDHRRWELIAKANSVDPNRLKIGQVLRLPPRETAPSRIQEPVARRSRNTVHTVRPGDSLSSIALMYYNDRGLWKNLYAANRATLDDPDALEVGMKLRIP